MHLALCYCVLTGHADVVAMDSLKEQTMKKLALAGLLALGLTGCSSDDPQVLNLYNWSEYMPQEVLTRFEKETGVKVVYTTYDSNEAMYARLKLLDESAAYDLAVPSTYYVSKMRQEDLLMPIDRSKIDGFDQLDPELVKDRKSTRLNSSHVRISY